MNILIFQRILPPYRLPIFRALYQRFAARVCYSRALKSASLQSITDAPDFAVEELPRIYIGGKETAAAQNPISVLRRHKPQVVVSEFAAAYLTMWFLFLLRPIFGYKLLLWTHAVDNTDVHKPFVSRRGRLALWLFKRADGIICYSRRRCELVRQALGASSATQLFVAPNTLDTAAQNVLYEECEQRGRDAVRAELGMTARFQLVYIGRLIADKRIDLLLASFNRIAAELDAELHVIGDGPERQAVEAAARADARIHCHGAVWDPARAGAFLYAADINLNPGYLGLSLVHSFSFATPIVSCASGADGPFHSPEIEYLEDGVNGLLLASDASVLASAINNLLPDHARLNNMAAAARHTATKDASLQAMMNGFEQAFTAMQESPSQESPNQESNSVPN